MLHHILILVISIRTSLKVSTMEIFFPYNISFLCPNVDDLYTLLVRMNIKFNIIGKTETRFKKSHT